jgi:hypothetical protein
MYPGGPRIFTIAEQPRLGSTMGLLFIPVGHGLALEHTNDQQLLFYVVAAKSIVRILLDGFGRKTARIEIYRGGTWEVPCRTTLSMINVLSRAAQVVL